MAPPDPPNPPDHAGKFVDRTATITRTVGRVCGTGWLLFMCWVMWTCPDRLGPGRMIGGLALASVTATCTVLWWQATLRQKERLDKASDTSWLAAVDSGQTDGPNRARLHHLERQARR